VAPLVGVALWKHIPKMLKFDYFGNEQWIHEVLDFLVVNFKGQQRLFPWTQKRFPYM
jgi:hypothetical protein